MYYIDGDDDDDYYYYKKKIYDDSDDDDDDDDDDHKFDDNEEESVMMMMPVAWLNLHLIIPNAVGVNPRQRLWPNALITIIYEYGKTWQLKSNFPVYWRVKKNN